MKQMLAHIMASAAKAIWQGDTSLGRYTQEAAGKGELR